jgi:hypothetical protein
MSILLGVEFEAYTQAVNRISRDFNQVARVLESELLKLKIAERQGIVLTALKELNELDQTLMMTVQIFLTEARIDRNTVNKIKDSYRQGNFAHLEIYISSLRDGFDWCNKYQVEFMEKLNGFMHLLNDYRKQFEKDELKSRNWKITGAAAIAGVITASVLVFLTGGAPILAVGGAAIAGGGAMAGVGAAMAGVATTTLTISAAFEAAEKKCKQICQQLEKSMEETSKFRRHMKEIEEYLKPPRKETENVNSSVSEYDVELFCYRFDVLLKQSKTVCEQK